MKGTQVKFRCVNVNNIFSFSKSILKNLVPGFVPVFAQNVNLGKKQYDSRYRCFTWNPTVFCPVPLRAVSMAPEGAAPSII